jgi:hypothetical protein
MTTDLAPTEDPTLDRAPMRALPTLAVGVAGGCALGVIARAWMRLISEDPEFTWQGTIFIVVGFTVFGLGQSFVAVARRRQRRRWKLTVVRMFGVIAMLPLFAAAGALMFPTVIGCGLAVARREWRTITRSLCLLLAVGPVGFVGHDLVDSFGWSLQTLAGFVLMLAIYATIIWATRFAFSAQRDGLRLSRRTSAAITLAVIASVSVLVVAGGGFE